jgi:MFS family permease
MTAPPSVIGASAVGAEPRSVFHRSYLPITLSTLTTVALAAFDGMSVSAALPKIGGDLGHVSLLPWVLTSFTLLSTLSILTAGPLIDALGVRAAYRFTLAEFLAASVLCAVAPNMVLLIVARALQGIGGGMAMAVALANVGLAYPPGLRSRAFAANSSVWGLMSLCGPAIAAVLVSTVGWRAIFSVNVPLVLFAASIGWRRLPAPTERHAVHVDARGLVLLAVVNLSVVVGVAWHTKWSFLAGAVALVGGGLYWIHSGRAARPVLERRWFSTVPFWLLNVLPCMFFAGALGVDAFVPLYVQGGLGHSAGMAAFAVTFLALGWSTSSQIASRVLDHVDETVVIVAGFFLLVPAVTIGLLAYRASTPVVLVFAMSFLQGGGIGAMTNATVTLLQRFVAPGEMGRASSAHQFLRNLGGTIGTATAGSVLFAVVQSRIGSVEPVRRLLAGDDVELGGRTRAAIASGFRLTHLPSLCFAVVGLVVALQVRRLIGPGRSGRTDGAEAVEIVGGPSVP